MSIYNVIAILLLATVVLMFAAPPLAPIPAVPLPFVIWVAILRERRAQRQVKQKQ